MHEPTTRTGNQYFHRSPRAGELFDGGGYSEGGVPMDFDLWIPSESLEQPRKTYPMVIYLHGHGQRKKKRDGVRGLLADSQAFRDQFVVLVPKCAKAYYWFHPDPHEGYNNDVSLDVLFAFRDLLDEVMALCPVDDKRVTLVGVSMGGFGALTYLEHCGDFITSVVLLGAHFDGTFDDKFIKSVYRHGIDMKTFDAIIDKCKERDIQTWILHGTKDKSCSYLDMLVFYHACKMKGYDAVGLQIDGNDKPLKSHTGPYDWMFGDARFKYSPNPLGAFCMLPEVYDDAKDYVVDAASCEDHLTTRDPTVASVSSAGLRDSRRGSEVSLLHSAVESAPTYEAAFPPLGSSNEVRGGKKMCRSSNFSTNFCVPSAPSPSYMPAAAPPAVFAPAYEEAFPLLGSNDVCNGKIICRSSNFSNSISVLPTPNSFYMSAAPPPVPAPTYEDSFPLLGGNNAPCSTQQIPHSPNVSSCWFVPPAASFGRMSVAPPPVPVPTYEEYFPPLGDNNAARASQLIAQSHDASSCWFVPPAPSSSYAAASPPVSVPKCEVSCAPFGGNNAACSSQQIPWSPVSSSGCVPPAPSSSYATAPPLVSVPKCEVSYAPFLGNNAACSSQQLPWSPVNSSGCVPPAPSSSYATAPPLVSVPECEVSCAPFGGNNAACSSQHIPQSLNVSSSGCVPPSWSSSYASATPPSPVRAPAEVDKFSAGFHMEQQSTPPLCSSASSSQSTARNMPRATPGDVTACFVDVAAPYNGNTVPTSQQECNSHQRPPSPESESPRDQNAPSVSCESPAAATQQGNRATHNPSWEERGRIKRHAYGVPYADRRAKDIGGRGKYQWEHDWSYYRPEKGRGKRGKDEWGHDWNHYDAQQKERGWTEPYKGEDGWRYYNEQGKERGGKEPYKGKDGWRYYNEQGKESGGKEPYKGRDGWRYYNEQGTERGGKEPYNGKDGWRYDNEQGKERGWKEPYKGKDGWRYDNEQEKETQKREVYKWEYGWDYYNR